MNVLVTASARMVLTPDGNLWTPLSSLDYQFWTRYLDVYDEVRLMVRSVTAPEPPEGYNQATGPKVTAAPVPPLFSPKEMLRRYGSIRRELRAALQTVDAVHLRLPCPVGELVGGLLEPERPFGVEVVGDPYDVYAPGNNRHAFRPVLRWRATQQLKALCARATGAAYVTEWMLQRRYPPSPKAFTTHYSSIRLTDEAFAESPRVCAQPPKPVRLVGVGTMEELYKGFHILIEAVGVCTQQGMDVTLTLVGDGKYRQEFAAQAEQAGLSARVHFAGYLTSADAIRQQLDASDIFVLPSFQEGLPKAIIEAMARGLPCIGSTVGGTPELLPAEELVSPGDGAGLAQKIREVAEDPGRMTRAAARNLEKAREYRHEILCERRITFYRHVREETEAWLRSRTPRLVSLR